MPPMWWKLIKTLLLLFALFTTTTTTDDASFMPIPAMLGDQPAPTDAQPYPLTGQEQHQQPTQQLQQKPNHYHQYQGLSQEPQSFKVQRSPDGKLNLVFNDPLISLQQIKTQPPGEAQIKTQTPRQPISDNQYTTAAPIDTGTHQCADNFKESRSFCTKVANYPDISGLKNILARNYANFFTEELTPPDLAQRMNDDEQFLCNSRTKYLYPELGQSVDKSWQVIVNTQEFKQAILIEECINEGESCQFLSAFPIGYVPVCKQHYVIRHLATVNNATSGQPEVANMPFKIPSCCKCVIKSKPGS